jgi:DNA replication licensing factor MCM2
MLDRPGRMINPSWRLLSIDPAVLLACRAVYARLLSCDHLSRDSVCRTELAQREVSRRFKHFLLTFVDGKGNSVYKDKIKKMCDQNRQSLEVSYMHLSIAQPTFGMWVADVPDLMLEKLNDTAMQVVKHLYPDYDEIHNEIFVRITDLPITDKLRDIRQVHLNALIKVR